MTEVTYTYQSICREWLSYTTGAEIVQDILDGKLKPSYITGAFFWFNAPENVDYWKAVRESAELSDDARQKLETMIAEYNSYMKRG